MKIILDEKQYNAIWDKLYRDFHFLPSVGPSSNPWLIVPMERKVYHLNGVFSEAQEKMINSVFCKVNAGDMYALDWHHDCFVYDPREEIPFGTCFYDVERDRNVYFPSYYPDGDYHFFVSLDWSIGLYGHPWRKEIIVAGERLIQEFEDLRKGLDLAE